MVQDVVTIQKMEYSFTELFQNLKDVLSTATAEQLSYSKKWYEVATKAINSLAVKYPRYNKFQIAGIVSAFSPKCNWDQNLIVAERFLTLSNAQLKRCLNLELLPDVKLSTRQKNKKAAIIASMPAPTLEEVAELFIKTQKTYNFLYSLLGLESCTLDVHALNAMTVGTKKAHDANLIIQTASKKGQNTYQLCSFIYKLVADDVNLPLHVLQAVVWVAYRENVRGWNRHNS